MQWCGSDDEIQGVLRLIPLYPLASSSAVGGKTATLGESQISEEEDEHLIKRLRI